jgi:gliding motility-associated-like protein
MRTRFTSQGLRRVKKHSPAISRLLSLRLCGVFIFMLILRTSCFAQFDAGPNDSINPGVPVTLTAKYGEIGIGVTLGDDEIAGPFPIGFNFSFFGSNYTQFYIGSNGWISFSPNPNASGTRQAFAVPNSGDVNPKNCILGPFQDYLPLQAGSPYVFYLTIGNAPTRKLVVMWCRTQMYDEQYCPGKFVTFQIILHEGINIIENHIFEKPQCDWLNNLATLGVQNATGFIGYAVPGRNGTSWSASSEAWRYTPTSADSFKIAPVAYNLEPITPGEKVSYRWYQGSALIGESQSVVVAPVVTTMYHAVIRLCDGQEFTDSVTVAVIPFVPNAFTPNGDGLNDVFRIYGIQVENITRYNFQIYDRWGQLVFFTSNILEGWDGSCKGQICPSDVYAWVIYYEDGKKTKVTRKGIVTLVR